jgi:hypothetical protein
MGASPWTVFDTAKHKIAAGGIDLSGDGSDKAFRMSLHSNTASTNLSGAITVWGSIGSECTGGGYSALTLSGVTWGTGASAGQQKFDFTDPVFTASASILTSVRYAVVYKSTAASSGIPLIFAALSTASFSVTTSNTLTIQLATTGAFTLA